ncbi:divalent-cation tolerance protein CutA-like isoform X1 [Diadema setosum]|uniref:divalent-cation tolerance protein CutA-like isoform X1 n=3 Tax=Diadema TaxID=31174 RepID=UPI003B3B5E43
MTRLSLLHAFLISLAGAVCMSLILSSSRGLLRTLVPTRLLSAVTMATTAKPDALTAVFVTVPDVTVGKSLASKMVEQKLVACVNIIPGLTSVYEWEGKVETDSEALLMIKTRASKVDDLSSFVRENHPYDVAEVISLPIENGNPPYLDWVLSSVPK